MPIWIRLNWRLHFSSARFLFFFFFFFFFPTVVVNQVFPEQCIRALFTDPQTSLFSNIFIKNGSHSTIHIFKNYFAIIFSVFSFSKICSIQTDLNYDVSNIYNLHKSLFFTPSVPFFFVLIEKSNFLREHHLLSCLPFKNV